MRSLLAASPVRRRSRAGAVTLPRAAVPPGIRRRRRRDIQPCARLLRRALFEGQFPGHGPEAPRAWLEGDDVLSAYVAEQHGEIVGHVAVSRIEADPTSNNRWREVTGRPVDDLAAVSRLFVRPRFRGQGYGSALLDVAATDIRARGLVPVHEVVTETCLPPGFHVGRGWRLRSTDPRPGKPAGLWVHRLEGPAL